MFMMFWKLQMDNKQKKHLPSAKSSKLTTKRNLESRQRWTIT